MSVEGEVRVRSQWVRKVGFDRVSWVTYTENEEKEAVLSQCRFGGKNKDKEEELS